MLLTELNRESGENPERPAAVTGDDFCILATDFQELGRRKKEDEPGVRRPV